MHLSAEPYSQKCGSSKPNFSFVAMNALLSIYPDALFSRQRLS
jgi:hypothetical protein